MRLSLLPSMLLAAACAAADSAEPVFVPDFVERSTAVRCAPLAGPTARGSAVADLAAVGDTAVLALYADDREVALFGPDLTLRRLVPFAEEGPTGVRIPVGAALLGDTLLVVADQARQALKLLDLAGDDRGTIRLPFPPQHLAAADERVLITPLVIGRHPRHLLHDLAGGESRELPVPTADFADPGIAAMANQALTVAYPDGRLVIAHRFVLPIAYEVRPGGSAAVRRLRVPLPDGVRAAVAAPPRSAGSEALETLSPTVMAASPDPRSGDLLFLTRSGRRRGHYLEKSVVRLDADLGYRRSYLLDVNAIHLAYLAGEVQSIVVDEEDRWYRCPTP